MSVDDLNEEGPEQETRVKVGVVTLFPEMFSALTDYGVSGRAVARGLLEVRFWNPRDYAKDRHRSVDDRPYGGGPGMLMKVDTLRGAIFDARQALSENGESPLVVYLSPQGRPLDQKGVEGLAGKARKRNLVLVAGRYEGIDQRVIESDIDEQISIGDYVLSGGELPAMVLIDALSRLVPGVLGHKRSAIEDSFTDGLLDCPHYTRPEEIDGKRVPGVLLGGNHDEIRRWRLQQSLGRTWQIRPELLQKRALNVEEQRLLDDYVHNQHAALDESISDSGGAKESDS